MSVVEEKSDKTDLDKSQPITFTENKNYGAGDEIDLRAVWSAMLEGKKVILFAIALLTFASVIFSFFLPNIYRSETLLTTSAEVEAGGGLSDLAGKFGGLASIAGVNLSSNAPNQLTIAIETLRSRKFINEFIASHELLPALIAAKDWSRASNKIILDPNIYNQERKEWVRDVSLPKSAEPSEWEAYEAFRKILSITQDEITGLVSVKIDFYSPFIAKQWVDWLVVDINNYIRKHDLNQADHAIKYLYEQLESTSIAGMQAIFYQLIEEQTKTIMLANVRKDYFFKEIDPAFVPEDHNEPNRIIITILGMTLGGVIGCAIAIVKNYSGAQIMKSGSA